MNIQNILKISSLFYKYATDELNDDVLNTWCQEIINSIKNHTLYIYELKYEYADDIYNITFEILYQAYEILENIIRNLLFSAITIENKKIEIMIDNCYNNMPFKEEFKNHNLNLIKLNNIISYIHQNYKLKIYLEEQDISDPVIIDNLKQMNEVFDKLDNLKYYIKDELERIIDWRPTETIPEDYYAV